MRITRKSESGGGDMSHFHTPKLSTNGQLTANDDGTNITFGFNGTDYFRVVKNTGNFQASGGFDSAWGGE